MKQNYKCLEEQHYKAQERIQSLLVQIKCQNNDPSSLYPCDECTKNFLTLDSLKSHQQRKHSIIAEKHELSDDNEKENDQTDKEEPLEEAKPSDAPQTIQTDVANPEKDAEKDVSQLKNNNNNNNDDNETNVNCNECSQKMKINSSTKAIQCEESTFSQNTISHENTETQERLQTNHEESKEKNDETKVVQDSVDKKLENDDKKLEIEFIQTAYETISELKKEIVDLKNSLEAKPCVEAQRVESENSVSSKIATLTETNDKIDVIEQKFNAFEVMYTESQHQFIESFRNLDERQKIYMDSIQETIKDIVEKSLGKYENTTENVEKSEISEKNTTQNKNDAEMEKTEVSSVVSKASVVSEPITSPKQPDVEQKVVNEESPRKFDQSVMDDSPSYSEDEATQFVCEAEVHAPSQNESNQTENEEIPKIVKKKKKVPKKRATKDVAINEFQQRLRQIGVEMSETGLPTPRSSEINQDLAEEREEIKKAIN